MRLPGIVSRPKFQLFPLPSGAVFQPLHNGQGIGNNLMAGNAVNADNCTDAAGIMLKLL